MRIISCQFCRRRSHGYKCNKYQFLNLSDGRFTIEDIPEMIEALQAFMLDPFKVETRREENVP